MWKKIFIGLLVILVVIQFIRPAKNISTANSPNDITAMYQVPDSVYVVLQRACLDCHSDNTRYPWYNNIQPVAWWLNDHVQDGKRHLNFSEFGTLSKSKQVKKLKGIGKVLQKKSMPLDSYLWIHKDAVLTDHQAEMLTNWANDLAAKISAQPS